MVTSGRLITVFINELHVYLIITNQKPSAIFGMRVYTLYYSNKLFQRFFFAIVSLSYATIIGFLIIACIRGTRKSPPSNLALSFFRRLEVG